MFQHPLREYTFNRPIDLLFTKHDDDYDDDDNFGDNWKRKAAHFPGQYTYALYNSSDISWEYSFSPIRP